MARNRKDKSPQQSSGQSQRQTFYIILAIVIVIGIGFGVYTYLNQPPEVSEDRLELEASRGAEDASVTVYEFGAYGCTSCRRIHQAGFTNQLFSVLDEEPYRDRVRFVFVNFPRILPSVDRISAEAAQCVLDQGQDAFWTYHNAIYDLTDREYASYGQGDFVRLAEDNNLDAGAVENCLENDTHVRTVDHNEQRGDDRLVTGTPTFFVNDQRVGTDITQIENAIAAKLNS